MRTASISKAEPSRLARWFHWLRHSWEYAGIPFRVNANTPLDGHVLVFPFRRCVVCREMQYLPRLPRSEWACDARPVEDPTWIANANRWFDKQ
jgi:hypothetical protein